MDDPRIIGRQGQLIAKTLWPGLKLETEGSDADKGGQDAIMGNGSATVQIKTDARIATTGNIYLELYEKTKGRIDQPWRHSPTNAQAYIFVTQGFAVWISVHSLAEAIKGKAITQINPTSIGVLVPLTAIPDKQVKPHNLWDNKIGKY